MTEDVYVLDAVRTPIGRHGGALAGVRPDDLAAGVISELLKRSPALDPAARATAYHWWQKAVARTFDWLE